MTSRSHSHRALLALALAGALASGASAVTITREFSASWYDPAHSGHGFNFEVITANANKLMLGYWYTYDAQGNPSWVYATGPIIGDQAQLTGYVTRGGAFGNSFNPANVQIQPWGTLTVTFASCTQGTVQFNPTNPALASGSMPITRLTSLHNTTCSGGISGDSQVTAGVTTGEIVQFMDNTGAAPAAKGTLHFNELIDRTDFSAEAEDLPVGAYSLTIDGVERGSINVVATANGSRGALEFRSPVEPGKLLLDFDPRGKLVQIHQASTLFLTATLAAASTTPPPPPPPGGGSGAPPFGNAEYRLNVEPTGNNGPELSANLEQRADRVDFKVEVQDVPAGDYGLRIGGNDYGTLTVSVRTGGTEGQVEFRNPVESGKQLLDFDPRGQLIEISSATGIVLSGMFPNTPSGAANGDDNGGNGSDDGAGDDNGGNGGDDGAGDDNGGNGGDDGAGDDNGGGNGGGGDDNGGG